MDPRDELEADDPSEQTGLEADAASSVEDVDWTQESAWTGEHMPADVKEGDLVTGTILEIQEDGVAVDVGAKYEGVIPILEFPDRADLPAVDEKIEVAVVKVDEEKGTIRLSKKRADFIRLWNELEEGAKTGAQLNGTVVERVKGGLRVDVGVSGFVPASQVATRDPRNLERYVGQTLRLKLLEADRRNNKVILSHRQVIEEERDQRRAATMARLQEGMVCEGKVRSITNYGAFIDLGGVDGLLHVSEMAWGHVRHPSEIAKEGDIMRVVVLKIEDGGNRISLGRRQILPDPWKVAAEVLKVGQTVKVTIARVIRNGAFGAVAGADIEGFIPQEEMGLARNQKPDREFRPGQELEAQVLELDPRGRKLRLSIVAVAEQARRTEAAAYGAREGTMQTLGDRFPDLFREIRGETAEEPEAAAEAPPAAETPAAAAPVEEKPAEAPAAETAAPEAAEPETEAAEVAEPETAAAEVVDADEPAAPEGQE